MPDLKGVVNFHPILSTNCLKKSISNSGIMRFTFCNVAVFIINHFLLNNSAKIIITFNISKKNPAENSFPAGFLLLCQMGRFDANYFEKLAAAADTSTDLIAPRPPFIVMPSTVASPLAVLLNLTTLQMAPLSVMMTPPSVMLATELPF